MTTQENIWLLQINFFNNFTTAVIIFFAPVKLFENLTDAGFFLNGFKIFCLASNITDFN
jgi:hypothetical protein